ncbi:cell division protein FtsQ/DivIB [Spirosoma pomorum]
MFSTFNSTRKWALTIGGICCLFGLIAFTEIQQGQKHVQAVVIHLDEVDGHRFLTNRDVRGYLTNEGADPVIGKPYNEVDFRQLEQRLLQHGLVKKCQVSRDLRGNLLVTIEQPRPVARLMASGEEIRAMSGQYVSEEGRFFPLSMNYAARVPILTGAYFRQNRSLSAEKNQPLLNLLNKIQQDPFWRAQITELSVDEQGSVTMWPQIGSHQIELGLPTDLDVKFKKLKLVYTDVLPAKGWDRYKRVSVQYRNQIVCE